MPLNLEPSLYVDANVFATERERVFARTWQLAGPAGAVAEPGAYTSIDVAGMRLFVLRGSDGELRAFRNVCRHRGAMLLPPGEGRAASVRCPYHNWVYDDRGRLVRAPSFGEDGAIDLADWPLERVAVETWRGLLFVAIDPQTPLDDQLGDTAAELADEPLERYRAVRRESLVFDANWKIYTDNFVEGYHIPGIHPAFFEAIDFTRFETTVHEGLVRMSAPPREGLFYRGRWLWMWPNWTLSLFTGGMNTSRINPLGPGRTELVYHFWFEDDSEPARAGQERTIERNLAVVREDFRICVDTHANYASGAYRPGPLSPRHEAGVRYFQERVRAAIG